MPFAHPLTQAWNSGQPVFGAFCGIPSSVSADFVADAGFDYVCVDMQHGVVDFSDALTMITAVEARGCVPLVRVPANEPWLITKVLDAGALGVIVPLVNTPQEAARAAQACRYPPLGTRSFGPVRSSVSIGTRDPAVLSQVLCIVMIETTEGLANVDQIAGTPGVDALYVGPNDLAFALGLPPAYERPEPEHGAAIRRIREAAEAQGKATGVQCQDGAAARRYAEEGFRMLTVGSDHPWLRQAATRELDAARAESTGSGG